MSRDKRPATPARPKGEEPTSAATAAAAARAAGAPAAAPAPVPATPAAPKPIPAAARAADSSAPFAPEPATSASSAPATPAPAAAKPPAGDTFEVACPSCKAILVIGRDSGEVLEHRKLTDEEAQARRVEEAFDRARRSTELAEQKFAKAKEREKSKMDRLSKLFDETMKKKIEEGDTSRPERPFDLD